ncbi:MAG: hypothetical protein WBN57_01690 [Gammaproteobacteria bacterium]
MSEEKRKGDKPVPDNLKNYLNDAQRVALHKIEGFGWNIAYVRRPLFVDPLIVISNADGSKIGILEEDGRLNLESDIIIRK